jgi:pilus assembly protein CpaC
MSRRFSSDPSLENEAVSMKTRRTLRLATLTAGVLGLLLAAAPPLAIPAFSAEKMDATDKGAAVTRNLQLGVGKSVIVDLPEDANEIYVGEPKVANAIVRSARRLYVSAVGNGQTSIFAIDRNGRQIAVIQISVGRDVGELKELLSTAIPGNEIQVHTVADRIVLTGAVNSAGEAQKAIDIANGFLSTNDAASGTTTINVGGAAPSDSKGSVINAMTIKGLDQISLRVTISEIRRDILKQLGVNLSGTNGSGTNAFQIVNPFSINGAVTTAQATLGLSTGGGGSLSATIQAFERQGVARLLAEPTVTAVSGESAKFLAGGTIPVPASENCQAGFCTLGFIQQPYGVSLNFTPVVLSQGRIQLHIATEVTDIDESKQLTIGNTSIPGFRTRKNETTVELPSGGSVASAGLISTQTAQAINGIPGLMNLPVLGSLFRSRDFVRNETELLIVVTPFVVHAIDPHEVVNPDMNFSEASDPQAWFLGRVNRIYSTSGNLQRPPTYIGRVGFIND